MTSRRTRDRLIAQLKAAGIQDQRVLRLIESTPRHQFVDEALASRAYENTALPIGHGQTISQPYIVARMTEALLSAEPLHRVLEIGTGCGYQTAILAQVVTQVVTIERIEPLIHAARRRLDKLGFYNITYRAADGYKGYPALAPYDGIILTAAPPTIPPALLEQLAPGGVLVAPRGQGQLQELVSIQRNHGSYRETVLDRVTFVPMVPGLG